MGLEHGTGLVDWNMGLERRTETPYTETPYIYTAKNKKKGLFIASYSSCSLNSVLHLKLCICSPIMNTTKKINHTCIYPQWETIMFGNINNHD